MSKRAGSGERGATVILVAIVMTALMSVAALAVDVAAMHQERRELQSGADAAALALAEACARGSCGTTAAMSATAKSLANANAHDSLARVVQITPAANQITIRVGTEQPDGGADHDANTIDFTFARVFGVGGRDVQASATAQWSAVSGAKTLPITFSRCEWARETDGGTRFYHLNANNQLDPVPVDPPSVIRFHDSGNANGNGNGNGNSNGSSGCAAQAGQDVNHDGRLPGGFGWLQNSNCQATIIAPGWVAAKPGDGVPNGCEPSMLLNRTLLIAVFADEGSQVNQSYGSCTIGPGGKCYFIVGFAQIYVTGFRFPGGQWTQNAPCGPSDACIAGYFIDGLVSVADVLGGGSQDFGPTVVELIK